MYTEFNKPHKGNICGGYSVDLLYFSGGCDSVPLNNILFFDKAKVQKLQSLDISLLCCCCYGLLIKAMRHFSLNLSNSVCKIKHSSSFQPACANFQIQSPNSHIYSLNISRIKIYVICPVVSIAASQAVDLGSISSRCICDTMREDWVRSLWQFLFFLKLNFLFYSDVHIYI